MSLMAMSFFLSDIVYGVGGKRLMVRAKAYCGKQRGTGT